MNKDKDRDKGQGSGNRAPNIGDFSTRNDNDKSVQNRSPSRKNKNKQQSNPQSKPQSNPQSNPQSYPQSYPQSKPQSKPQSYPHRPTGGGTSMYEFVIACIVIIVILLIVNKFYTISKQSQPDGLYNIISNTPYNQVALYNNNIRSDYGKVIYNNAYDNINNNMYDNINNNNMYDNTI